MSNNDKKKACTFCGDTKSEKIYTKEGDAVQCKNAAACIRRV